MAEKYRLERGHLQDAVDPNEVPRTEIEDGVIYIFTRVPYEEKDRVVTVPLLVAVGNDFLLTVSPHALPFFDKFKAGKMRFSTTQKTKLAIQIFSEVDVMYTQFLNSMNRRIRSISISMDRISNNDIVQFVTFEGVLNDFVSALVPMGDSLNKILKGRMIELYEQDQDLIEDVILSNDQLIRLCDSNIKMIVNIRSAYSTIMTNKLNKILRILAALTVILTVPMIITGAYGMNVMLPFADSPHAFWIVSGIMGIVTAFLLGVFISKQWL